MTIVISLSVTTLLMTSCVRFRTANSTKLIHMQGNLSVKPSLQVVNRNTKAKAISITRGSEVLYVQPSTTQDIQDEDIISLVSGITLM